MVGIDLRQPVMLTHAALCTPSNLTQRACHQTKHALLSETILPQPLIVKLPTPSCVSTHITSSFRTSKDDSEKNWLFKVLGHATILDLPNVSRILKKRN
uniref:Uncharacterized protein n=1 Tax=Megaselia scalaris TaxID=36166 RepID=T1H1M0_MEGSC